MKRYVFEIVIDEGYDEFWEELKGKSGVDEVQEEIERALSAAGFQVGDGTEITLIQFGQDRAVTASVFETQRGTALPVGIKTESTTGEFQR